MVSLVRQTTDIRWHDHQTVKRLSRTDVQPAALLALMAGLCLGAPGLGPAWGATPAWNLDADGNCNVNANWTTGAFPNGAGASALLGSAITADRTVTLGQDLTLGNLTFDSPYSYTLSGANTLTFDTGGAGPATLTVNNTGSPNINANVALAQSLAVTVNSAASTLTFAGNLSGAGGLTLAGPGTVSLSGVNTYTGPTVINGGTLSLGWSDAIPSTSAVTVNSGALWDMSIFDDTVGSLSGAGNVYVTYGTLTVGADNTSTTFGGVMSGLGNVTKTGTGTWTLTGLNSYLGATTISAGTLALGANDAIPSYSAVTVAGGATFNLNGYTDTIGSLAGAGTVSLGSGTLTVGGAVASTTFAGTITGTGGLTKTGIGTLTLSGANNYTGPTLVNWGTLLLGGANAIGGSSALTVANGATFNLNGYNATPASLSGGGNVALGNGTLSVGGDNSSTTFSGIMSGTGGMTKTGNGTLTLSGLNTYSGTTLINAGTLALGAANALPASSGISVANGATLNLANNNATVGSLAGAGNVTLGSGALTVGADNTAQSFSGVMSGAGALTKMGGGTWTLTGANTLSGAVTIAGGSLSLAGANGAAASASGFTINYPGTLALDNTSGNNNNRVGGTAPITLNGGALNYLVNAASGSFSEAAGPLSASSGASTVTAGQAASGQTATLTFSSLARTAGATLDFEGTGLGASTRNEIQFASAPPTANGIVGAWATVGTNWAGYSGSLGITPYNGYYTGGASGWGSTINAWPTSSPSLSANKSLYTLSLSDSLTLAIANNRTLNLYGGGLMGIGTNTISGGTVTAGGNASGELIIQTPSSASALTVNSVIADNGNKTVALTKSGPGTLILGGANTYSGATVLNAGSVQMNNRQALGAGALTLNNGVQLRPNWTDPSNYAPPGSITINSGSIVSVAAAANPTLFLPNNSSATLTINGPATLTEQGNTVGDALEFDGPVVINGGGTLTLNAATANDKVQLGGSQPITIAAGGTLTTDGDGPVALGTTATRLIVGQGTASQEAVFAPGDNLSYNANIQVNGSGTGGLRVQGDAADVNNFLSPSRIANLTGSGGTLTMAVTEGNVTNTFAAAPSSPTSVQLGFDTGAEHTNVNYVVGAAANDMANWGGLVVKGGIVTLATNETFAGGASTLTVSGGTLSLASGSPPNTHQLTINGDATLTGGYIDAGPGGGTRGGLVVGGNIYSEGTVLVDNPDVTMDPASGTTTVSGSTPLLGMQTFTKTGAGNVTLNQSIGAVNVVINQGTLLLGAPNQINSSANMTLAGGTFGTGGNNQSLGLLTLGANSTIDLGASASVLRFLNSSAMAWSGTLTVNNWTGSYSGGGQDQLSFGSTSGGLTTAQVANILFNNPNGSPGILGALILGTGEVVPRPVPEPATIAFLVLLLGVVGRREWAGARRAARA